MPEPEPVVDPVYTVALLLADWRRTSLDMAGSRQPTDPEWDLARRILAEVAPPLAALIGEKYSRATRKAVTDELWEIAGDPPTQPGDAFKRWRTIRRVALRIAPEPTDEEMAAALADLLGGLAARTTARSPEEENSV